MAQQIQKVTPVLDSTLDLLQADFQACRKPAKWKSSITNDRGERLTVTHKDGRSVYHHIGLEVELIRISDMEQMQQMGEYVRDGVRNVLIPEDRDIERITEEDTTREGMARRREQFHTGNHGPRNHPVRVPTRAGQPVRG